MVVTNKIAIVCDKETTIMKARMSNPAMIIPGAMQALQALAKSAEQDGVPQQTLALVHLRASQINGCGVCVDLAHRYKKADDSDQRLFAVAAWRDTPFFSDAERAALALAEAVTRLSHREDPVPDEIWNEAASHYDERALAALILYIAVTNVWNRLNVSTRQIAGDWAKSADAKKWIEEHAAAAL
jgi:AhpD family alkylhydroperoxidase